MLAKHLRKTGGRRDPYFQNVALLLHGDGNTGSPTFVDSSLYRRTPTVFGDPQLADGAILFNQALDFDGTGDYLRFADAADLRIGVADFTLEMLFRPRVTGIDSALCGKGGSGDGFNLVLRSDNSLRFVYGSTTVDTASGFINASTASLYYVSIYRVGGILWRFTQRRISGSWESGVFAAIGAVGYNFNQTDPMYVGASRTAGNNFNGWIDELRLTIGVGRGGERPLAPYPDR